MKQREKLIELLDQNYGYVEEQTAENLADYLLANGVVVLPCRCCECEHYSGDSEYGVCHHWQYYLDAPEVNGDDFCSYGERKGGDE